MNTHSLVFAIVNTVRCKPGWSFRLMEEDHNLRLVITVEGLDSRRPSSRQMIAVSHYFPVPEATYNYRAWRRWVFECCRGVENHELGEWFRVGTERPFLPLHGPGENPYFVHEFRDEIDARTTQDGSVREPYTDV